MSQVIPAIQTTPFSILASVLKSMASSGKLSLIQLRTVVTVPSTIPETMDEDDKKVFLTKQEYFNLICLGDTYAMNHNHKYNIDENTHFIVSKSLEELLEKYFEQNINFAKLKVKSILQRELTAEENDFYDKSAIEEIVKMEVTKTMLLVNESEEKLEVGEKYFLEDDTEKKKLLLRKISKSNNNIKKLVDIDYKHENVLEHLEKLSPNTAMDNQEREMRKIQGYVKIGEGIYPIIDGVLVPRKLGLSRISLLTISKEIDEAAESQINVDLNTLGAILY